MSVVTGIVAVFLAAGLCVAQYICPHDSVDSVQDVFGSPAITQRGIWHRLPCPTFRQGEALLGLVWYKGSSIDDTNRERLISHSENGNFPASNRYTFSTDLSLIIKGVKQSDEGRYLCQVIPLEDTERDEVLALRVFGDSFPASTSEASSTASFQRGRRQTLPCECASQTPDVVYWSTGEGETTDTQIIGARFSDGVTLQIQHGADYSIGSDASLTVSSLNDVQDTQRFWCHVFQSDGTLRNCDTNVQISVDEMKSASDALKASERSFYLRNDTQQILPCLSWTPGDTACEVEWSKLGNPDRQVLSYNLSTGVVDPSPEFDLASDFGLVIQSVDDDHAGVYRCAVGDESQIDVEVRVLGDRFPLDGGSATEGKSVIFEPETRFSLQCPALSDISLTFKATLFWSFGAPDAESTTVIGTLNLPEGPIKMSDPGDNSCLDISLEGALLFNNCSQDDDVRYWCHVFPANDNLIRSYVDVLIEDSNGIPESFNIVVIAVCVFSIVVLMGLVLILMRKWRRRYVCLREDKERGDYRQLLKQEPVMELDLMTLASKIKSFVSSKLGRIPITPWVDRDDACFASIDEVYTPLEMFVNVSNGGITVKYRLDSEAGIFDDGIPELASKHAIIQGRRGCGKSTFLHRLIYDWAMGRKLALWGSDQIVVLVPAWLLIKAKTIGGAVVECMLPKDANISAESINAHYARDKSNLTILVDDCNDKEDIDAVMKVMTDNEYLDCQFVLTTRSAELAKAESRKHKMRHLTITGFTLEHAIGYINVVLDAAEDRKKATPEHKAVKSKAEPKAGSTADTNIQQNLPKAEESPTVSAPPEIQESTATFPEKTEPPKTPTKKRKRNFHRYLEEDILPPDISCLPAVLAALCQLSIWTKGDAFQPDVTMANLFLRLVKFMLDKMKGPEVGVTEIDHVLAELGRVAYSRLVDSSASYADISIADLLSSSENGQHVLKVAIKLGFLRQLQVESKVEYTEQSTEVVSSVSEVEIRTGFLCCKREQESGTEPDPTRQDTELTPLTRSKDERIYFALEILEQFSVAVFLAQTTGKMKEWFEDIRKINHREILYRFSNVLQFAIQDSQFDREDLVGYCAMIINRGYGQVRPFHVVLQLQKFVELCLQLNFEGQCEGALNKKLKSIFPYGRVRLIGISSYKLRLLSYLLEHAQPEDKSKLYVKSVELFRIGRYDWSELQKYIEYFVREKNGTEKKTKVKTKPEYNKTATTAIHHGKGSASDEDTKQLPEHPLVHHPLEFEHDNEAQAAFKASKKESQSDLGDEPKSDTGQTTSSDPRTDIEKSPVDRAPQTDQSQSTTQQSSVPLQHMAIEQTSSSENLRNEPKSEVQQPSVSDVNVGKEKVHLSNPQSSMSCAPFTRHQSDTRHSTETDDHLSTAVQPSVNDERRSDPGGWENASDDLSLSDSKVGALPGNEDESIYLTLDEDIVSYDVIDSSTDLDVPKKLRQRTESSSQDMPRFPPYESDISVLHTVQSFGLQELLESQAGECYSSGAARDLARYLPRLEMLESLVLIGTILSSDAICDLAKSAHKLPNLKMLDLRLNRQFDDRAFVAVTNFLLRHCKMLTDLRLSLYRVRSEGFDQVQEEMNKGGENSWGRLKTLYLLHGSPAETFVRFLTNSLQYFHFVERFHLSATYKSDKIENITHEVFEQNMKNPRIMPNLDDLDIGNMETLKARLASLKLPKKKKGPGILKRIGEAVGSKTASEIAESETDTKGGPAGAITRVAVEALAAVSMPVDRNYYSA